MIQKLHLNRLEVRLPLFMLLIVVVAVGLTAFFAQQGTTDVVYKFSDFNIAREKEIAAGLIKDAGQQGVLHQAQIESIGQQFNMPIMLVGVNGDVLAAADPRQVGVRVELPSTEAMPVVFYKAAPTYLAVGGYATDEGGNIMTWSSSAPAPEMFTISAGGTAAIPVPMPEPGPQPFIRSINQTFMLSIAASLILTTVLSLGLSRRILTPIEALTAAARKMEKGDLDQRVDVKSQDEIGELAHAFNAMAGGLSRADQLRRGLVSDVAHELRTPLANVRGYLEAMRDGVVQADAKVINSIYEEAMLLNRLIDDLQELAQAEAGQLKLARQPASPADLVTTAVAAAIPQAAERGLTLKTELAPDLPLIAIDEQRIGQALRNLVANAIAHTPAGGEVMVSAVSNGENVVMSVRDTGEGIALEHQPFIFERFYRGDASRARTTGGSGLGLAIVKQWVTAHGGQIEVASEVGKGSTFTMTLPLTALPT
jgi:signal transduction histidine kinase